MILLERKFPTHLFQSSNQHQRLSYLPSHNTYVARPLDQDLMAIIRAFFELGRIPGNGEFIDKTQTSWNELRYRGDEAFDLSFPPIDDVCPSLTLRFTLSDMTTSILECEVAKDTDVTELSVPLGKTLLTLFPSITYDSSFKPATLRTADVEVDFITPIGIDYMMDLVWCALVARAKNNKSGLMRSLTVLPTLLFPHVAILS
ncbi:hypothetical protein DEU56DRAFT_756984 [Suillus clintonianus]|uniref:uncharacterized protein n=1 Tax=Suillus clintonianus TaxID=1904413 RepID=UPI001B86B75B|nr:uncharacterized protein DEU56DRAFT_756984 [Suillus clintonianus]KAG2134078.1 hypothetical protein DEU56DRAFT_756984 [Suillus clintonianus]